MPFTDKKQTLKIVFYTRGTSFDGSSVESKGLGGSESALLYIARELAILGHKVNVFCNCDTPGLYQGVNYHHEKEYLRFCSNNPQDIGIFSRYYEKLPQANATIKILWIHDRADVKYYKLALPVIDSYIHRYFLISNWQKQGFIQTHASSHAKLYLTRNGVDKKLFQNPPKREPNKLIYINTPFRGLDVLLDIFPKILESAPDTELHVYSGMSLYGETGSDENSELHLLYEKARSQPNIFLKDPVPKPILAKELMTSRLSVYPSHFEECCSIASLECQAAGTPMITTALAGLNDTIIDNVTGILIPVDSPESTSHSTTYQKEFIKQTLKFLGDDSAWQNMSKNAHEHIAENYSWKKIASEWEQEFYDVLYQPADNVKPTLQPARANELTSIATQYFQLGAHTQALETYRQLCTINPSDTQSWHMRSAICGMLGEYEESVMCCETALSLAPNTAAIYANYAIALTELKRYEEALSAFTNALSLNPGDLPSIINQAKLFLKMGELEKAHLSFTNALGIDPNNIEALNELGQSHLTLGKYQDALKYFLKTIEIHPDYAIGHTNTGSTYLQLGNYLESEYHFKKSLQLNPDILITYCNLAYLHSTQGDYSTALDLYDQALGKQANYEAAISGKAVILERQGEIESAANLLAPVIKNSTYGHNTALTYARIISELGQETQSVNIFKSLLEQPSLSHEFRIQSNFALGKLHDRSGDYNTAFEYYRTGNKLSNKSYNKEAQDMFTDAIITTFNRKTLSELQKSSNPDNSMIFILGMPRSGTTLVEQTLSAHTDIYGAGELIHIKEIAEAITRKTNAIAPHLLGFDQTTQQILDKFSFEYSDMLRKLSNHSPYITDKMPSNFHFLGYIALLFPKAKIIHCVRNPLDTCLSCYFQNFSQGQDFAYNLSDLAHYYNSYLKLMHHWKHTLQLPILDVHYESMVSNHEETSRGILNFLDIEWSESCLDFHKTKRKVTTASYNQVRKPIYKSSLRKWENYQRHLKILEDQLNE